MNDPTSDWALPSISRRSIAVWRRNALVWRKLAIASILGNLADPMITMLALGYGLGALLPSIQGVSYIVFLAAGSICFSTMNSASFEALYSAFSRMHVQRTWDAILNAPVSIDDVVFGELVWTTTKATLSGFAILAVAASLGLVKSLLAVWIVLLIPIIGFTFAGIGLVMTALARGYDFFTYYFTLLVTPMSMIGGVFFPIDQLPTAVGLVAQLLPLTHAVALVRPLLLGEVPGGIGVHLAVLLAYGLVAFYAALVLLRRRLVR
jgi:lipooligosaccharide transport system permease protein